MIGHKLPNKTKNATVVKPKLFHQLNRLYVIQKISQNKRASSTKFHALQ
jgi:hypothetical protein